MAYYYPTQNDINILTQPIHSVSVNIFLLDFSLKTIGSVTGTLLADDMSVDVDSDIRKTFSLSFAVKNGNIDVGEDKNFWLNRLVKIEYIIVDQSNFSPVKYDRGVFILTEYAIDWSDSSYTMSLKLNDQVSMYNGDISGTLGEYGALTTIIPVSDCDTVRDAMLYICELAGITEYIIGDANKDFPYDLEFSNSQTIWDMIVAVRDLYPGWEAFFDVDGKFVFQEIPTGESDTVVLDANVLGNIAFNESIAVDILGVKNVTKVWGKCIESDYYADEVTYSNGNYTATFSSLPVEEDGTLSTSVKLAVPISQTNEKNPKLIIKNKVDGSVKNTWTFDIVDDNEENLKEKVLESNCTYVFRHRRKKMFLMGRWQIVAASILVASEPTDEEKNNDYEIKKTKNIVYVVNPDSPFCREYIGERIQSLSGGDCEDIDSEQKAKERAEYENWRSARISYSLTLNCVYVPFLYGNEKIAYKLKSTGETKEWIIKKISGSWLSHTMTLNLAEFYPLYPYVVKN